MSIEVVRGKRVLIRFEARKCIHSRQCVLGRPDVFVPTLCRCGASKHKPFCDGSHAATGFVASGEPATQESSALAVRNGPVKITPQPNASLGVEGNLEICSGTGRTVRRVTKAYLCRCGHSANKPFCDATHAKIGFDTEST